MSDLSACPCLNCIAADHRLTEEFVRREDAAERIADLTAKGTLLNSCYRADRVYLVCYRGVRSTRGVLPRYEGQAIDAP